MEPPPLFMGDHFVSLLMLPQFAFVLCSHTRISHLSLRGLDLRAWRGDNPASSLYPPTSLCSVYLYLPFSQ